MCERNCWEKILSDEGGSPTRDEVSCVVGGESGSRPGYSKSSPALLQHAVVSSVELCAKTGNEKDRSHRVALDDKLYLYFDTTSYFSLLEFWPLLPSGLLFSL